MKYYYKYLLYMKIIDLSGDCIYEIVNFLKYEYNKTPVYRSHKSLLNFILTCKHFLNNSYYILNLLKPLCKFKINNKICGKLCSNFEDIYNLKRKIVYKKKDFCQLHIDKCNWLTKKGKY